MDTLTNEKQKEKLQGRNILINWFGLFKNIKLYKAEHPSAKEAANKFCEFLNKEIFRDKLGISISNIDGLFMINDVFFIEESLAHYELLYALENHNISIVMLNRDITHDEAINFCAYLLTKKLPGIPDLGFNSEHIKAIPESKESWAKGRLRSFESKYRGSESFIRMREHYDEWLTLSQQVFTKLLDEQALNISEISDHLDQLIDVIHQNPGQVSSMLSGIPVIQLNIQHSIHSMIYSIFLGQQLSLDSGAIKTLALGALLHDIGRWFLPADFTTGYSLQKGDIEFIQLHARDGASYLAGVPGLPMNVVRMALEHHIGYDGKGYPELPNQNGSNFLSQIVGIADFMSWGTVSEHHYHKPIPPHRLVRSLMARAGTQFDPLLVKLFIPFFGLYPAGTMVRLNTGEQAIVIEPNTRNISRPQIAIQDNSGHYTKGWLMTLSKSSNGSPYEKSVKNIVGSVDTMEIYFDLLQDADQT